MIIAKAETEVLQAFLQRVHQIIPEINDAIRETQDQWGTSATEAMKANHGASAHEMMRYENRTFDLTESIGYDLQPAQTNGDVIKHPLRIFAAAPYAYDVENGVPGKSRAYPFFWKEVFSGEWSAAATDGLTQRINDLLASSAERS